MPGRSEGSFCPSPSNVAIIGDCEAITPERNAAD